MGKKNPISLPLPVYLQPYLPKDFLAQLQLVDLKEIKTTPQKDALIQREIQQLNVPVKVQPIFEGIMRMFLPKHELDKRAPKLLAPSPSLVEPIHSQSKDNLKPTPTFSRPQQQLKPRLYPSVVSADLLPTVIINSAMSFASGLYAEWLKSHKTVNAENTPLVLDWLPTIIKGIVGLAIYWYFPEAMVLTLALKIVTNLLDKFKANVSIPLQEHIVGIVTAMAADINTYSGDRPQSFDLILAGTFLTRAVVTYFTVEISTEIIQRIGVRVGSRLFVANKDEKKSGLGISGLQGKVRVVIGGGQTNPTQNQSQEQQQDKEGDSSNQEEKESIKSKSQARVTNKKARGKKRKAGHHQDPKPKKTEETSQDLRAVRQSESLQFINDNGQGWKRVGAAGKTQKTHKITGHPGKGNPAVSKIKQGRTVELHATSQNRVASPPQLTQLPKQTSPAVAQPTPTSAHKPKPKPKQPHEFLRKHSRQQQTFTPRAKTHLKITNPNNNNQEVKLEDRITTPSPTRASPELPSVHCKYLQAESKVWSVEIDTKSLNDDDDTAVRVSFSLEGERLTDLEKFLKHNAELFGDVPIYGSTAFNAFRSLAFKSPFKRPKNDVDVLVSCEQRGKLIDDLKSSHTHEQKKHNRMAAKGEKHVVISGTFKPKESGLPYDYTMVEFQICSQSGKVDEESVLHLMRKMHAPCAQKSMVLFYDPGMRQVHCYFKNKAHVDEVMQNKIVIPKGAFPGQWSLLLPAMVLSHESSHIDDQVKWYDFSPTEKQVDQMIESTVDLNACYLVNKIVEYTQRYGNNYLSQLSGFKHSETQQSLLSALIVGHGSDIQLGEDHPKQAQYLAASVEQLQTVGWEDVSNKMELQLTMLLFGLLQLPMRQCVARYCIFLQPGIRPEILQAEVYGALYCTLNELLASSKINVCEMEDFSGPRVVNNLALLMTNHVLYKFHSLKPLSFVGNLSKLNEFQTATNKCASPDESTKGTVWANGHLRGHANSYIVKQQSHRAVRARRRSSASSSSPTFSATAPIFTPSPTAPDFKSSSPRLMSQSQISTTGPQHDSPSPSN